MTGLQRGEMPSCLTSCHKKATVEKMEQAGRAFREGDTDLYQTSEYIQSPFVI
jgi:hypothetical protein